MRNQPNWEGRPVGRIRDITSGEVVDFIFLTDTDEIGCLWVLPAPSSATVEALPGADISGLNLPF